MVFDDRAVGVLKTYPNESSLPVDSLEAVGPMLLITRGDEAKAVPLSKVESADPILDGAGAKRGKAAAA